MEPYRSYYPNAGMLLPHTMEVADRVIVLPTGTAVGQAEIAGIASVVRVACGTAGC